MNEQVVQAIERDAIFIKKTGDYQPLIDIAQQKQYVLLGESSHGTSEFYKTRAELSKILI